MPLRPEDRAAYMRAYRAKWSEVRREETPERRARIDRIKLAGDRITELEEEVRRLKAELAKRMIVAPGVSKVGLPTMTNAISAGSGPIGRGVSGFGAPRPAPKPKTHR